jgi:hypothetical protein
MVCPCHPVDDAVKVDSLLTPSSSLWRMDGVKSVCLSALEEDRRKEEKGRERN